MGTAYETTLSGANGSKRGNANPAYTNDAAHVMDGFTPSTPYATNLTMDGTATTNVVAIATGVARIRVANLGATAEAIYFAFGTSSSNASANLTHSTNLATTGVYIPAATEGGSQSIVTLKVPDLATHFAIENAVASDTQDVNVIQGV